MSCSKPLVEFLYFLKHTFSKILNDIFKNVSVFVKVLEIWYFLSENFVFTSIFLLSVLSTSPYYVCLFSSNFQILHTPMIIYKLITEKCIIKFFVN